MRRRRDGETMRHMEDFEDALAGLAAVEAQLREAMLALAGGEVADALRQLASARKRLRAAHQRFADHWWGEFWRPYRRDSERPTVGPVEED